MEKVAFVCVFHQSDEHRPNGFKYLNLNLESIFTHCKYPFKFFGIDNQSSEKFEVENNPDNLQIIRNNNQVKTGTTGAWNIGIKEAVKQNFDIIRVSSLVSQYANKIKFFVFVDWVDN